VQDLAAALHHFTKSLPLSLRFHRTDPQPIDFVLGGTWNSFALKDLVAYLIELSPKAGRNYINNSWSFALRCAPGFESHSISSTLVQRQQNSFEPARFPAKPDPHFTRSRSSINRNHVCFRRARKGVDFVVVYPSCCRLVVDLLSNRQGGLRRLVAQYLVSCD
jgi:hypothetical protein